MNSDIRTSRYGLGMIMKTGWSEFIKNWKTIIPIALLIYIPANLIIELVPGGRGTSFERIMLLTFTGIPAIFIKMIVDIALAKIIEESIADRSISLKDAYLWALSRWPAVVGTNILGFLIIAGLILLLIVPGIIWAFYYFFFLYVVTLRGLAGKKALDYSKALVEGQWWRVFFYILFINGVYIVVGLSIWLIMIFTVKWCSEFWPIINDSVYDIIVLPFKSMMMIFFLNCDYLKHKPVEVPPADIPEQA